jgi:hypothetical protein
MVIKLLLTWERKDMGKDKTSTLPPIKDLIYILKSTFLPLTEIPPNYKVI